MIICITLRSSWILLCGNKNNELKDSSTRRSLFLCPFKGGENLCIERKKGDGKMPTQEVPQTMEEKFDNHEGRIVALEKNYGEVIEKMGSMEKGQLELQTVILKSSGDQKDLLNKLIEHNLGITVKQEETKGEISKLKINSKKEITLALLGGGGIVGIIASIIGFWDKIAQIVGG